MTFEPEAAPKPFSSLIEPDVTPCPRVYLPGEVLEVQVLSPVGSLMGVERFQIETFTGSGFAGQVYKAAPQIGVLPGSQFNQPVALKFLRPSSLWKEHFRDILFFLSFQTTFAPRLREAGLQSGLLLTKILHQAIVLEGGQTAMLACPLGYFWDERLNSFAEIYSWENGRPPLYTPDDGLLLRWLAGKSDPPDNEMQRKKEFMAWLVDCCNRLGASGVARQYEWGTWVAQSNVLTRFSSQDGEPEFVAVDWRPGLAAPFFLPLSPVHARLILRGIWHGNLVQFDQLDLLQLQGYLENHSEIFDQVSGLWEALLPAEHAYRQALPDLWQSGDRLLKNKNQRVKVRAALIEDWEKMGRISDEFACKLRTSSAFFNLLFFFSFIPFIGSWLQKLVGSACYRAHLWSWLTKRAYRRTFMEALCKRDLLEWHWHGRLPDCQIESLASSKLNYLLHKLTLSWLPASFHRLVADRRALSVLVQRWFVQPASLLVSADARSEWLKRVINAQVRRGVVLEEDKNSILQRAQNPRLHTFMRDLGLFVGLEIFSRLVYLVLAVYGALQDNFWPLFIAALGPISPSGVLRFIYISIEFAWDLPGIFQQHDLRLLAARLSGILIAPWRFIGNMCVPIEMFAYEPYFALLMADYLTSELVQHVPVLGGRGKLLEFKAFQLTFNLPLSIERALRESFSWLANRYPG